MSDDASIEGLKIVLDQEINQMEAIQAGLTDLVTKVEALERFHTLIHGIAPSNGHTKTMAGAVAQLNAELTGLIPLAQAFREEAGEYIGAL